MAVNVAVCHGDTVTAAAVADPFTDVVDWTDGTFACRRVGDRDRPLVPSVRSLLVDLNVDAVPGGPRPTTITLLADERFTARFGPRVLSTTLALAWVASGQRAAYLTDGHLAGSVHFTAGIALCQAAGCVVTNLAGGPIHTGRRGLIAAADADTHDALVSLVPASV